MHTPRFLENASVIGTRRVAAQTFLTEFHSPRIASEVKAGQFVMVSFPGSLDPLLPRAFSVCEVKKNSLSLFYVAVGKGTSRLSTMRPGEIVVLNGPLGRGFPELARGEKVWIVVGGSGAAVLPILVSSADDKGASLRAYYGAKTEGLLMQFDGIETRIATDDGSKGFHGTVVQLLKNELQVSKPDKIFACGPTAMLVNVQKEFANTIPTFISVETPMACGMGLCQGCPVKRKNDNGFFLACKDGPVFDGREVELITGSAGK